MARGKSVPPTGRTSPVACWRSQATGPTGSRLDLPNHGACPNGPHDSRPYFGRGRGPRLGCPALERDRLTRVGRTTLASGPGGLLSAQETPTRKLRSQADEFIGHLAVERGSIGRWFVQSVDCLFPKGWGHHQLPHRL